ncbi:MAG TPA: hypothetical protein VEH53_02025 [archaeon]|nr:hypothetical protein [archaeon]
MGTRTILRCMIAYARRRNPFDAAAAFGERFRVARAGPAGAATAGQVVFVSDGAKGIHALQQPDPWHPRRPQPLAPGAAAVGGLGRRPMGSSARLPPTPRGFGTPSGG